MRKLGYLVACAALIVAAAVTNAAASAVAVPEVNPSAVAGGLGLLAAGVLLLRARFGK